MRQHRHFLQWNIKLLLLITMGELLQILISIPVLGLRNRQRRSVFTLFSGYLIIYNIFSINVYRDITYYGLLKTIETTGKQLKKIVRRQAYVLALFGIPFGLFAGVFISSIVLPFVMRAYETMDGISSQIELNIGILLGAALFSMITVWVGCSKPCRIASRVTPVEAIQYTEGQP